MSSETPSIFMMEEGRCFFNWLADYLVLVND